MENSIRLCWENGNDGNKGMLSGTDQTEKVCFIIFNMNFPLTVMLYCKYTITQAQSTTKNPSGPTWIMNQAKFSFWASKIMFAFRYIRND